MTRTFIDAGHRWLGYNENNALIAYQVTALSRNILVIECGEKPLLPSGPQKAYELTDSTKNVVETIVSKRPTEPYPWQFYIFDEEAPTEQEVSQLWHEHYSHTECVPGGCETYGRDTTHVKDRLGLETLDGSTVEFKLCTYEDPKGVYGQELVLTEASERGERLSHMCLPVEAMDQLAGWLTSARERADAQ